MTASAPTRTSLWAIASLACGVMPCPPLCLIAIVLGAVGLVQVRMRPEIGGRGLAIAGIALGLLVTLGWGGAFSWWHVNVRRPLIEGPGPALTVGLSGDVESFRAAFVAQPPAAEAATFLATLADRYGALRNMRQDDTAAEEVAPGMIDRERPVVRYQMRFDRGTVTGEAEFVVTEGGRWPLVLRWGRLTVQDAERGDLTYPVPDSTR